MSEKSNSVARWDGLTSNHFSLEKNGEKERKKEKKQNTVLNSGVTLVMVWTIAEAREEMDKVGNLSALQPPWYPA